MKRKKTYKITIEANREVDWNLLFSSLQGWGGRIKQNTGDLFSYIKCEETQDK